MRSPIIWFGGKGKMTAKLLPLFPQHYTYVEAFGGGASMLFAKHPAPVEVYNDLDGSLVAFFRVLRDPATFAQFQRFVSMTPYARAEWEECRDTWEDTADPIERAARWYVVACMSFSGAFGHSWSSVVTWSGRGMAATASKWLSAIAGLPRAHARLMRVQIEQSDWRVILERYDTPETFFYLDPPYVHSTRKSGDYAHEMEDADHAELVAQLLELRGLVMLSGYASAVYAPLAAAGWQRRDWHTACHAAGRTRGTGLQGAGVVMDQQARVETVWMNYEVQRRLF